MSIADVRRERLLHAQLYFVTDADGAERALPAAFEGGVDIVQLREKEAPDADVVDAARRLRQLCDRYGALLIVNDRPDLALECDADGVHVGQDDEPLEDVRRHVGSELIVGISTHSRAQVDAALESPADYLGVGPVYATPTKEGREPVGLELVRYAAERASAKPWFAIGGIDADNAGQVAAAGATRIAVVRAIRNAEDPQAAANLLRGVEAHA